MIINSISILLLTKSQISLTYTIDNYFIILQIKYSINQLYVFPSQFIIFMIIQLLLIILVKFTLQASPTIGSISVSANIMSSNQSINQQGDIQFAIQLHNIAGTMDNNARIVITFPNQFSLAGLNPNYISFYDTSSDECPCDVTMITASIVGRVVTLSNFIQGLSIGEIYIWYSIKNVTFPITAKQTSNFTTQIWDPSNMYSPLISDANSNVLITSLNCGCTLTPTDLITGARTSLTILITSNQPVLESKTSLQIVFPTNWIKSVSIPIAANTGVTCSPLLNTSTSINCTSISNIVTVKQLFYGNISSSFSFQMDGFVNPPITSGSSSTQVFIKDSNSNINENCLCTYQTLIAGNMAQINFKMTAGISSLSTGYLSFIPRLYNILDNITIVFPSDFSLESVVNTTLALNNNNNTIYTASISSNTIKIKPNVPISNYNITIPKILSPPSQKKTGPILITTSTGGYTISQGSYCCYSITTLGTLNSVTITPLSTTINVITNYIIRINITNPLTNTSSILIYFPIQFNLSNSNSTLTCDVICTILNNSNLLRLNLSAAHNKSSLINVNINQILNPTTIGTSNNFTIITVYDNGGGYVDTYTGSPINFTSTLSTNVAITTTSNQVYQNTSLKILINNTLPLTSGTIIQINIPVQFTVLNINCTIGTTPVQLVQLSTYNYQLINAINSNISSGGLNSSTYTITLNNLLNPISKSTTSNFVVILYTNNSIEIERWVGSPITLSVQSSFSVLSIKPVSLYTGAVTNYKIYVATPFLLTNSCILTLSFGSQISIGSFSSCSNILNLQTVSCLNSSTQISLPINLQISTNTIQFLISGIKNPTTVNATAEVTIFLSVNSKSSCTQSFNLTSIYIPNIITYTLTYSNYFLGEPTNLIFTISTTNTITSGGYIYIYIPSQYTFVTGTLSCASNMSSLTCINISNYIIKLFSNPSQIFVLNFNLSITGYKNPIKFESSPFSMNSFNSLGALFDSTYTYSTFTSKCNGNCKTCSPLNASICTSCYTNVSLQSTISNMQYLFNNTCVNSCGLNYFLKDYVCTACNAACYTCSGNLSNNCLSCNPFNSIFKYLDLIYHTCNQTCISSYFNDDSLNQCTSCTNNCSTCISLFECTACLSPYFLYNFTCTYACPSNMYNDSNQNCFNCGLNCVSCTDAITCLICNTPYLLYSGGCYINCLFAGSNLYYDINTLSCSKTCSTLHHCMTCFNISSNCTSCNLTSTYKYYFASICLSKCPDGYYYNSSLISCTLCPTSCLLCINFTYCSECTNTSLFLYNGSCINSCPNTTANIGGICLNCTDNCSTCNFNTSYCLTCVLNSVYFNNQCLSNCPSSYYNFSGICMMCNSSCSSCVSNDPNNCTYCNAGYFLHGIQCISQCPNAYMKSQNNNTCTACLTNCLNCTTSLTCSLCDSNFYILNYSSCITLSDCNNLNYYRYNSSGVMICTMNCTTQCNGCSIYADSCIQCNNTNTTYLYNPSTMHCLFQCQSNYFQNGTFCIPCQSPCKTCDSVYNICTSCLIGYLYLGVCIDNCQIGYYKNQNNNCIKCSSECNNCSKATNCFNCSSWSYMYNGACYLQCPSMAPIQMNGYCSSCPKIAYCVQCSNNLCDNCVYPYYLYKGMCISSCPSNYDIDNSGTTCVPNQKYYAQQQSIKIANSKNLPFPCIILLIIFIIVLLISKYKQHETNYISSLLAFVGLMQFFSWIILLLEYYYFDSYQMYIIIFLIALLGINLIFNILNLIPMIVIFREDAGYLSWEKQGKNKIIQNIVITISIITNFKFTRVLFCRFFDWSIFEARLLGVDKFYYWNKITVVSIFFLQIPAMIIAILIGANQLNFNTRPFFESAEVILLSAFSIYLQLVDLRKDQHSFFKLKQETAQQALDRLKEYLAWGNYYDDMDHKITRTKSQGQIQKQQTDYRKILEQDYKSVYDPDDYQDVPKMEKNKIPNGIQKGKFRRRKKKHQQLYSISQESWESQTEVKKPSKGQKIKSYINNFIYWKPPQKKKKNPNHNDSNRLLPFDQQKVMQTIRQKESQFDIMSKNEDLYVDDYKPNRFSRYIPKFQQQSQQKQRTKISLDVSFSEQPMQVDNNINNMTFNFDPNDLINLNYARKKHLSKPKNESQEQLFREKKLQKKNIKQKRVGGLILKNTRY